MCALFELCTDSLTGVSDSIAAGAGRVELCSSLSEGGLTPSAGLIAQVVAAVGSRVPVHVLIRPRAGDFVYSIDEMTVMEADIREAARLGADGVVLGALLQDGSVDEAGTRQLMAAAEQEGLNVTFHRAFDMCANLSSALEQLVKLGVSRVLTSGGCVTAMEGADEIASLVLQSAGRIVIMAGAGLSDSNAAELVRTTGVKEVHGSSRRAVDSTMVYRRPGMTLSAAGPEHDYVRMGTCVDRVRAICKAIGGTS